MIHVVSPDATVSCRTASGVRSGDGETVPRLAAALALAIRLAVRRQARLRSEARGTIGLVEHRETES